MRPRGLLAAGLAAGALGLLAFLRPGPEGPARAPDITVPTSDGRKIRRTPASPLVAPDGRIVMHTIGGMDMAAVRRRIEAMLPAAPASG